MKRDDESRQAARPAPVRDAFRDELEVWDNDRNGFVGDDGGGAGGDLTNLAAGSGDLDAVSDLDRAFDKTMRPLKKLFVMFCSPKPRPTPTAPTSTFRDVRSIPALCRMTSTPSEIVP
jgi:hypothetical protein